MKKPSIGRVGMDSGSSCSSGASRADAILDVAVSEEVPTNPWIVSSNLENWTAPTNLGVTKIGSDLGTAPSRLTGATVQEYS